MEVALGVQTVCLVLVLGVSAVCLVLVLGVSVVCLGLVLGVPAVCLVLVLGEEQTVDISSVAAYYQPFDYLLLYSMNLPLFVSMFTIYFMNNIEKSSKIPFFGKYVWIYNMILASKLA